MVIWPSVWPPTGAFTPAAIDHIDFYIKDANTRQLARTTGQGDTLDWFPIYNFGPDLVVFKDGTIYYAGTQTSLNGTYTIPGVHACSQGNPDENGIEEADCGLHCLQ